MEKVRASENISVLVPENDTQELWQLSGRVDALHAWLMNEASDEKKYFSSDQTMVCILMGFNDVLKAHELAEKEKAGVTSTD